MEKSSAVLPFAVTSRQGREGQRTHVFKGGKQRSWAPAQQASGGPRAVEEAQQHEGSKGTCHLLPSSRAPATAVVLKANWEADA